MRLLELYSGIGGMHCAFERASVNFEVIAAIDINDLATAVYQYNFPDTPCFNRVIENLSEKDFEFYNADIWTLSPPCQPFTRLGKRKCETDNRTSSLHHLIQIIPKYIDCYANTSMHFRIRPKLILLENVKGFEGSEPWRQLIRTLKSANYKYQQFLLTPLQFGIPNCRLRFYLVAKLQSTSSCEISTDIDVSEELSNIHFTPPLSAPSLPECNCPVCGGEVRHIIKPDSHFMEYSAFCRPISDFLTRGDVSTNKISSIISDNHLQRYFYVMDLVRPSDKKTRCFTKGYSKRFEGTGSILQTNALELKTEDIHSAWIAVQNDKAEVLNFAKSLGLRFFYSREVANLMCFSDSYRFPDNVTEKQRLQLLGNSINVFVVAHVVHWALGNHNVELFRE